MAFLACLITAWILCFEVACELCCGWFECGDLKTKTECDGFTDWEDSWEIHGACQWNGRACVERTTCDGITDVDVCVSIHSDYNDNITCEWYNGVCKNSKPCGEYNSQPSCDATSNCSWANEVCRTKPCEDRRTNFECNILDDCHFENDGVCRNQTCNDRPSETVCNKNSYDCVWIDYCRTRSCRNFDTAETCDGVQLDYRSGYCKMIGGTCDLTTTCGAWSGAADSVSNKSSCESKSFGGGKCRYTDDGTCVPATTCSDWSSAGKYTCESKVYGNRCYYASDNQCRNATCGDFNNGDTNSESRCYEIGCKYSRSLSTCTAGSSCSDWDLEGSYYCESHSYNGRRCEYDRTKEICTPETSCEDAATSESDCRQQYCFYLNRKTCPTCFLSCTYMDSDSDADNDADSDTDSRTASAMSSSFSALSVVLLLLLLVFLL